MTLEGLASWGNSLGKNTGLKKCEKEEVVTAFSGLLELSRRSKVITSQENLFGDISVEKNKNGQV